MNVLCYLMNLLCCLINVSYCWEFLFLSQGIKLSQWHNDLTWTCLIVFMKPTTMAGWNKDLLLCCYNSAKSAYIQIYCGGGGRGKKIIVMVVVVGK